MLIFFTIQMIRVLVENTNWMCDGTFKIAPSLFFQIYTIHALVRDNLVPCIYVLLPDKSRQTYAEMWRQILQPQSIQIDFEAAARSAIQDIFPNTQVRGCFFYLGQSLYRRDLQDGLKVQYEEDPVTRRFVNMLMAIAFLPEDEISDAIDEIREHNDYPNHLDPIYDYFEDTYVGRRIRNRRRAPLFAVNMWSVRIRTAQGLARTNNQLEAWHGAWQGAVGSSHPSFFRFLDVLQREQRLQEANLRQIRQGRDLVKHLKKYEAVNRRLQRIIEGDRLFGDDCSQSRNQCGLNVAVFTWSLFTRLLFTWSLYVLYMVAILRSPF